MLTFLCVWLRNAFFLKKTPLLFGSTYMTMDNQYFEVLNAFIENLIEANGDRLITRDPAGSQSKQNAQILDMLDMGCSFIFVNPVDGYNIESALKECERRGVPFIAVDTEVYGEVSPVATIVSDNYRAGELVAKDLASKLKSADIVVLYDSKINSTCMRLNAFTDTLDALNFPYNIVYTASGTTLLHETMVEMQKFLNLNLDFNVVFGSNDPAALGALAAIQNNNMYNKQLIYGIDGSPSGKKMISQSLMEASAAQFPSKIAYSAVSSAYSYLQNKEKLGCITIPVELISKDNVDKFNIVSWQ